MEIVRAILFAFHQSYMNPVISSLKNHWEIFSNSIVNSSHYKKTKNYDFVSLKKIKIYQEKNRLVAPRFLTLFCFQRFSQLHIPFDDF